MTPQEFIDFVKADFDLTPAQEEQFRACDALYRDWKINQRYHDMRYFNRYRYLVTCLSSSGICPLLQR